MSNLVYPPNSQGAIMNPSENDVYEGHEDLEQILIDETTLNQRIGELGRQISEDYRDRELVLISILKGGVVFLADLMRAVTIHHQIELVGATSYKGGTTPRGIVRITKDVDHSLTGKDVLMVEDIYDTGGTLHMVYELLKMHQPASIEVCALLKKKKTHDQKLKVKYLGFEIEDKFVVGYGLDYGERYRNLPYIGVLRSEFIQQS